jgi:Flp pilus assembly pilin Flp
MARALENKPQRSRSSECLHRSTGASLVEYALLIGFVATIGILIMRNLGQSMSQQFTSTTGIISGN